MRAEESLRFDAIGMTFLGICLVFAGVNALSEVQKDNATLLSTVKFRLSRI